MTAPGSMSFTPNNLPPRQTGHLGQSAEHPSPIQAGDVSRLFNGPFREAEKFISVLNDTFNINRLELDDDVIQEALQRARQDISDWRILFEISADNPSVDCLEGVLRTLYLLFNEGCRSSSGESLTRETIRLARLLTEHPVGNQSKTHALLALMLLNSASAPIRLAGRNNLLHLKDCDRSQWDQQMLEQGRFHFVKSCAGDEITWYHLQARIAACHCKAKDYESTDWKQVLSLYDRLMGFDESPVVALNRAIVFANIHGPDAGFAAVTAIKNQDALNSHYLYYAVLGEFEAQLNDPLAAAGYFRKSLQFAESEFEQQFLSQRFKTCEALIPL